MDFLHACCEAVIPIAWHPSTPERTAATAPHELTIEINSSGYRISWELIQAPGSRHGSRIQFLNISHVTPEILRDEAVEVPRNSAGEVHWVICSQKTAIAIELPKA